MWKMIKQIKTRFCPNLSSGMRTHIQLRILDDVYASFSADLKNYILQDLNN